MLDEKKIEAIVDSNINLAQTLIPDSPIFDIKKEFRNLLIACVKRGAELAIEDLLHPASEMPNKSTECVIIAKRLSTGAIASALPYSKSLAEIKKWGEQQGYTDEEVMGAIEKNWNENLMDGWFNLDELLPKKKGGNNERI